MQLLHRRTHFRNFTPLSLGPELWLDPSVMVANNNDVISTWNDLSGNGRNATATTTQRPTYNTNLINGLPGLTFNGTSNYMTIASIPTMTAATYFQVVVVLANRTCAFSTINNGTWTNYSTSGYWGMLKTTRLEGKPNALATSGTQLYCVTSDSSNYITYVNRVLRNTEAADYNTGNLWRIGVGAGYFTGYMGELIIYPYVLTTAQRQAVDSYLKTKWGTP